MQIYYRECHRYLCGMISAYSVNRNEKKISYKHINN